MGDPSERERKEQIFFENLFDKAETFFNQTLPQLIDTEVMAFVQKTLRTGDTSIGDFILSHLLPVQMDTLIKFVKFLRCSWTSNPQRYPTPMARLINEYNPKTPSGLEGVNIGVDADTIQRNIGNQLNVAADQLKGLLFKPLPSEVVPWEEMTLEIFVETNSIYSKVKDLRKVFNSLNIPKAVSIAKAMFAKMMKGEEPRLEKLFLTILAKAQEDEFWEKLEEVATSLCEQRNDWLDQHLYPNLLVLIDETVVGRKSYDFDEPVSMANNTNSTENSGQLDFNQYFEEKLPLVFGHFKVLLLVHNFLAGEGYTCMNSKCHTHGIPVFRPAVEKLVPTSLDRLFNVPDIEPSPQDSRRVPPRYTVRNALGLDYLGPFFDNTKFFFGGIIVLALDRLALVDIF